MMALLGHDITSGYGGSGSGHGGQGGSGNGGGGGSGFYKKVIDALLLRRCIKCIRACVGTMRIHIDHKLAVKYTQVLVNSIDTAFKQHHGITLSSYIYKMIGHIQIPPAFQHLLSLDATRGTRTRVVKYVLIDLVSTVLPNHTSLQTDTMFQSLQPEIIKYVSKGKGDLSMLASAAMAYVLKEYQISGFDMQTIPCLMCHAFNRRCN
jgi:hypothetical protein